MVIRVLKIVVGYVCLMKVVILYIVLFVFWSLFFFIVIVGRIMWNRRWVMDKWNSRKLEVFFCNCLFCIIMKIMKMLSINLMENIKEKKIIKVYIKWRIEDVLLCFVLFMGWNVGGINCVVFLFIFWSFFCL